MRKLITVLLTLLCVFGAASVTACHSNAPATDDTTDQRKYENTQQHTFNLGQKYTIDNGENSPQRSVLTSLKILDENSVLMSVVIETNREFIFPVYKDTSFSVWLVNEMVMEKLSFESPSSQEVTMSTGWETGPYSLDDFLSDPQKEPQKPNSDTEWRLPIDGAPTNNGDGIQLRASSTSRALSSALSDDMVSLEVLGTRIADVGIDLNIRADDEIKISDFGTFRLTNIALTGEAPPTDGRVGWSPGKAIVEFHPA